MTSGGLTQGANAETSKPVPWQCWDIPGFKECHDEAGNKTYRKLVHEEGLHPDDPYYGPVYREMYPKVFRNFVYDCQRQFSCTYSTLEEMKAAADAHNKMGFPQDKAKAWLKWLAVAGAAGVGFWWYKKQR